MDHGFSVDEEIFVCPWCFEEEGLRNFIRSCGGKEPCTYCGSVGEGTCTLEELLTHAFSCIQTEWGKAADEGLPYESREGGWQGPVIDTWELLKVTGLTAWNDALQDKLQSVIEDDLWCESDPFLPRKDETFSLGWKAFSDFVMHEARYVFLHATPKSYDEHQYGEMHPVEILDALSGMVEEVGLLGTIPTSSKLYRGGFKIYVAPEPGEYDPNPADKS